MPITTQDTLQWLRHLAQVLREEHGIVDSKSKKVWLHRKLFSVLLLLSMVLLCGACGTLQKQPTGPRPTIYQGVYVRGLTGSDLAKLTAFERDAGKKAALVMWFQSWAAPDEKNFNTALMTAVRNHGSIPFITWEPRDFTQGPDQPRFALRNIINGNFDSYISQFAREAKAWGHPFFLRFAHEMNDAWAPWSEQINENKPGHYVSAWRVCMN